VPFLRSFFIVPRKIYVDGAGLLFINKTRATASALLGSHGYLVANSKVTVTFSLGFLLTIAVNIVENSVRI
jgi:hypothetical protein